MISANIDLFFWKKHCIDPMHMPQLSDRGLEVDVLRMDRIHPLISGNKWFKLKYHLEEALARQYQAIATWGGAFSNHLLATAAAARHFGFSSIGFVRGDSTALRGQTLQMASSLGMDLHFLPRGQFADKTNPAYLATLQQEFPYCYFIPEGGGGENGIRGSEEILDWVDKTRYSHIICAVGTGTMFCGLARSARPGQELVGVCVLKGMVNLLNKFSAQIGRPQTADHRHIFYDYHFGGYARHTPALISTINQVYKLTGIPLDFVYTGKLCCAMLDLAAQNYFAAGSRILMIHSGGLQGNLSLPAGRLCY